MLYTTAIFDDYRGVGRPLAWLAAGAVVAGAYLWAGGWSPWLVRVVQLLFGYVVAYLVLSISRVRGPWPRSFVLPLVTAIGAIFLGAGLATSQAQLPQGLDFGRRSQAFELALAAIFIGTLVLPGIFVRRSEEIRRQVDAERHARIVERETHLKQMAEMRLKALQAQIEPHFLFNTLANVQHLVRTAPAAADEMLESLIRYLKSAVPQMRTGRSTVGEELARVEAYLAIMGVRMGERLRYSVEVSADAHPLPLPPLSLVTLVENSVKHGLEGKPEGGTIRVVGGIVRGRLVLRVIDDGRGFSAETGGGVGLANLRERLATLYADAASLDLAVSPAAGVEATLSIPAAVPADHAG